MAMIIRTAFNNMNWEGKCQNADRDRRLFQCKKAVVDTGYNVNKKGFCQATCWESTLCTKYSWMCASGDFSKRASGRTYFLYRDIDGTLVLWGKSKITEVNGNIIKFRKFNPLGDVMRLYNLTYKYLESIKVPPWRQGTFRYISDDTADIIEKLIYDGDNYFDDPAEPFSDIEGKKSLRHHLTAERSSRLVRQFKASLGNLECSVCGFDFSSFYGDELGEGFIEAHHNLPLSSLIEGKKVSTKDLVALCSNCHRMLHRKSPPVTTKKLLKAVKQNGKGSRTH